MKSLSAFLCAVSLSIASGIAEEQVEIEIIKGGYSGETTTSRYWDCCKPTCGWSGNTDTKVGPVKSCAKDGATKIDTNTQSGCEGGTAYMCSNQQSVVINSSLAYGFAAAAFENPPENMCCTCFLITFKKGQWGDCSGKQMVVQITNTGAGSSNTTSNFTNIEIAIPGGGVGYYTTGCSSQWNAPATGWGDQYGGVATEADCNQLPAVLQPGCKFRWEFLNGCSNPPAHFQQVVCPKAIYKLSGCNMGLKDSEG
ncbi:endoglucanase-like isoform X2 [Anthonomus grandis grandis]|uniref:endoglucanase-like isoform X2 n=1 Tax=Anthonomus grandis grandis TaxID=2921223 RepID=UPI0021666101|nr:endoglucanase-like isoform X2 [Anthonomus grandis grandis]